MLQFSESAFSVVDLLRQFTGNESHGTAAHPHQFAVQAGRSRGRVQQPGALQGIQVVCLFREERTFRQKVYLVLWFGLPIMVGVWIRIFQKSFQAGDLSFETALLLGVIGGRWAGSLGGVLMGITRCCCTASGPRCRSTCFLVFSQANCAPWRSTRTTSGRSRRSSIKAFFASSGAICRVPACSNGRSCFSGL